MPQSYRCALYLPERGRSAILTAGPDSRGRYLRSGAVSPFVFQ
jgi:hypothetical protein